MRQFDFSVWIKKWARRYGVPPVPVKIADNIPLEQPWGIEQANALWDWQAGRILIHSKMLKMVEEDPDQFKYLKHVIAHEFGHYVSFSRRGITAKDTIEDIDRKVGEGRISIMEHEADVIAYELTGTEKADFMFWGGVKLSTLFAEQKKWKGWINEWAQRHGVHPIPIKVSPLPEGHFAIYFPDRKEIVLSPTLERLAREHAQVDLVLKSFLAHEFAHYLAGHTETGIEEERYASKFAKKMTGLDDEEATEIFDRYLSLPLPKEEYIP